MEERVLRGPINKYLYLCIQNYLLQVIQKREIGGPTFNTREHYYTYGFGDQSGAHWIGNYYIHLLTKDQKQQLKVTLQSADGEWTSATYSEFWIGAHSNSFPIHIVGYTGPDDPG